MERVMKHLVVSDLDDTLLGDDAALERFHNYFEELHPRVIIAYATGRPFESVVQDVSQSRLPVPVAVIGDVGTEIRHFASRSPIESWTRNLAGAWSAAKVKEVLDEEPDLKLQPQSAQSEYKVSYDLEEAAGARLTELQDKLLRAGLHTDSLYSSGQHLDVVPKGFNKGSAAACLARELGFGIDNLIVAGNSENDHSLFRIGCPAILVANASAELSRLTGGLPHVYRSSQARADGVQDGLEFWLNRSKQHAAA
jgi:sucrose-6F-phosphate phosphohydrolase